MGHGGAERLTSIEGVHRDLLLNSLKLLLLHLQVLHRLLILLGRLLDITGTNNEDLGSRERGEDEGQGSGGLQGRRKEMEHRDWREETSPARVTF